MTGSSYFLGVDGGGTKTRFALIDHHGSLLAETQLGTTYHPQVGLEGVRDVLARGTGEILHTASITAADISHAFFGLPAFGEDTSMVPRLRALPGTILGHDRYTCDNDMVCGWAGSLGCADGINIVAGTGSIGYGQRQGRAARAGGWGEAFSDEGSAYWIVIQGLNKYSRMSDGRLPKGPLYAMFNEALRLQTDFDICTHVYGERASSRGDLAQLSRLVARAAQAGDAEAIGIFTRAGEELAQIALAVRSALRFEPEEVALVSGSGGAFNTGHLLLTPFREALQATRLPFDFLKPMYEPHIGAALYAARLAGTLGLAPRA
jgi:N-acetylglucosamine kinase-like BadF-type ATPase